MDLSNCSTWTLMRFTIEVVKDRETFLRFCMINSLIKEKNICDEGHEMKIDGKSAKKGLGFWRCRRKHTDGKDRCVSVMNGTWFQGIHIYPEKALTLTFLFSMDKTYSEAMKEIATFGGCTSPNTISNWYNYCRELIAEHMETQMDEDGLLGGPDKVVEIDETKFGRRKYFVGRMKEGVWIFGMIERGSKRFRLVPCPGNKRDAATLLPIIQSHVLPGTIIMSDSWSAYNQIGGSGYFHFTVNHTVNFIDPISGAHTQTIESSWRPLKQRLYARGVREVDIGDRLLEYLFRQNVRLENLDPFDKILSLIQKNYAIQ